MPPESLTIILTNQITMMHKFFMILVIGTGIVFFGCSEDNLLVPEDPAKPDQIDQANSSLKSAKKPAAFLIGEVETMFTPTPPTVWNGTVDFGDYGTYALTFISLGPLRDFSQALLFEEDFVIYQLGTDWQDPANVVMRGWNDGVLTLANKAPDPTKFHANGKITSASEPLDLWDGCNFHIKGLVYWTDFGPPERTSGIIRIN
jgi:hypothetical protein